MMGYNAEFLDRSALTALGIGAVGDNVLIHRTAVLANCENLRLATNIRIDPFVVISAGRSVKIGRNVHIAAYASIIGAGEVDVGDFVGLAQGVRILASSDDFSGAYLTGPTISGEYKNVVSAGISIGRHAVIGAGSVIMPGCEIGEGAIVGALSFVNKSLDPWMIYAGAPIRSIRSRCRDLIGLESDYLRNLGE
jgi:acetyltransferase-like isoleucine patch superfamily enzyme